MNCETVSELIDLMQTNLYKFCGVDPISFWKFTPAETMIMIDAATDNYILEHEITSRLEARLCAVILTANGVMKHGKTPYDTEDFMPKEKTVAKTPEQLEQIAKAATMKLGGEVFYS